ncbi:asparagine synthase-related protein [Halorubrum sp. AD140]|uniref:asparagine synthase C-terminal domain-containing protein n=1 Tax=Halorubrum sp. AD140 TaxID=3050073 RepID=UPI002ACC6CFE|nr:asparagine synthase-related protein [Halorubrum sp. AD140]MDZ5812386.1 asparagine synthase-related protein [Halorubrum sp. AD140]
MPPASHAPSDAPSASDLRGAPPERVRVALREGDPLPGGRGFAGSLADPPGRDGPVLVRDVLGREPLFVERDAADPATDRAPTDPDAWAFDRTVLDDPTPIPAGSVASGAGVERVWTLPDGSPDDPEAAQAAVDAAVRAALGDAFRDAFDEAGGSESGDRTAVAFSGGVDSGVVAAGAPDAPCYVAGFAGCHDVSAAREAAAAMGRDLHVVEITHEVLLRAVREVAAATGRRNPMDVAIAVPLYLVAEAAAADGIDRLAVGQGADELFGGYSKVADPANDARVDADTVRGARTETVRTLPDQLERDVLTLRAAGVEPVAPLLDDRIVAAALALPGELLAADGERKVALRRAAAGLVPESVRTADKKAVQYGTYVSRELDRLARRADFKRRMDDHVGQYLADLLTTD